MALSNISSIYRERMEKTVVVTLPPEGKPYLRTELVSLVANNVGNSAVEAIGQRERNLQWEITFKSVELKNTFVSTENLEIKGFPVRTSGIRRSTLRLRVFYVPFYVPTSVITQQLEKVGVTVINAFTEKDKESNCNTNVRNIVVECDNLDVIPDRMAWEFDGLKGQALINVAGRPPRCLRCNIRGHKKFQCEAPYCKACRKVGHEESDLCRKLRPSFAAVTASRRDTIRDNEEEDIDEAPVDEAFPLPTASTMTDLLSVNHEPPFPTAPAVGSVASCDQEPPVSTDPTMMAIEERPVSWSSEITEEITHDNKDELTMDDFPPLPDSPVKPKDTYVLRPRSENENVGKTDKDMEVEWIQSKIQKRKLKENNPKQRDSDPTSMRKKTCPVLVTSSRQSNKKDNQNHSEPSSN